MSFKISYSYKVREGLQPSTNISVPEGTLEDFITRIEEIFERDSDKDKFRFKAEFG